MIDFENAPKKAGYIAVVIILLAVAYFVVMKAIKKGQAAKDAKDLRLDLDKSNLSFDITQYTVLADKLEKAIGAWNTDESAVFSTFNSLQNGDDVKQLIKTFGARSWTLLTGKLTLVQYIAAGMDAGEVEKVNDILQNKGIQIQF